MDGSGCKAVFKDSEIRRFLPEKVFANLEELRMHHEIGKVFSL